MTEAMQARPTLEQTSLAAGDLAPQAQVPQIDCFLAAALGREPMPWPAIWEHGEHGTAVVERIGYHGIAGLLNDRSKGLAGWPDEVLAEVRDISFSQAMWETRHRIVLGQVIAAFTQAGIRCLFLKGTGLAYDLYPNPATRTRGDSDVLIDRAQIDHARGVLADLGFVADPNVAGLSDAVHLQEIWRLEHADDSRHDLDVHWQVMNSYALSTVLDVETCFTGAIDLPRLAPGALTLDHVSMLVHTALHKATHIVSPYFAGGKAYFGGDRLIWGYDIHLLAQVLSTDDWTRLVQMARDDGTAEVCLAALAFARDRLGTDVPGRVLDELHRAVPYDRQSGFLLRSGQLDRAWRDLRAVAGWRSKMAYFGTRLLPAPAFVRTKYPELADRPLVVLYLHRLMGLFRERTQRGQR